MIVSLESRIAGCLLGTAVGDALGLPYEKLSPRRGERLLGPPTRHRFWWRGGMVSDDTEHAVITAQAWLNQRGEPDALAVELARRMRWWLVRLPAGAGKATIMACLRLWLGVDPARSGLRSAGNGAAMRAPILGVLAKDEAELVALVKASSRITHRHRLAEQGAIILALAARLSFQGEEVTPRDFVARCHALLGNDAAPAIVEAVRVVAKDIQAGRHATTRDFVSAQGWQRGPSGYILQTLPAVLHAWWLHPTDYRAALIDIIAAGGDADSTAALVGGIVGAHVGDAGIPEDWLAGLRDTPCSVSWLRELAHAVATAVQSEEIVSVGEWPLATTLARNAFFLAVVLYHGFRRLAPPY